MKTDILIMLGVLIFLALAVLAIIYDVAVWNECRSDGHSWFYCLRMISK